MILDHGEKVYKILSELIELKFKAQVKNSGIQFKKIYHVKDLETNTEFYSLIVNNEIIDFKDKNEFLIEFISLLEKNIQNFERRYKELQRISDNKSIDENQIYMEHEEIGFLGAKQIKLLKKVKESLN